MVDKNIYIIQGEISTVVGAIKRNSRWNTHTPLDEEQDPLLNSFGHLKDILNNIKELSDIEPNVFLRPFLEVVRSEDTTGPITGLALTSVNKFLSYGLIDANHEAAAEAIENMADAVTHARFVGTDPASDEVVLMKILQVLRTLLLTPVGAHLTNESVCEIMQSCFRICFEMRLSELLRKSAEHTLVDMVQLLFSRLPQFKEEAKSFVGANIKKLKMRAGGMSESSKWKKQKRSPRPPRHMVRSPSGQTDPAQTTTLSNNNLSGGVPFIEQGSSISGLPASESSASSISSPTTTDSGLDTCSKATSREDLSDLDQNSPSATTPSTAAAPPRPEPGSADPQVEPAQSTSVESIPEVLEDKDSVTEQSDSASVHDMDYVNPRGVRFTQSTQRDGASLIPYGLPCLRELFRFLISLTNPHDRHNTDAMMHMGLQLLTVALEAAHMANYQSLLGLVKDELCRHLFQLLSVDRMNLYASSIRVCFLLFESMRVHLKFQLEMYLKKLMDIITSENMKMPYEMKEMALEALVQLWRIPSFVTELYINYDCDFYCSNLFEDLTKLLSKNAFPVSGQLYTTHLLSLEALLTVIDSTEAHCQAQVLNSTDQSQTLQPEEDASKDGTDTSDVHRLSSTNGPTPSQSDSSPVCPPTSGHLMADKMRLGRQDQGDNDIGEKRASKKPQRFSSSLPDSQELMEIRTKKKLLITGTEQFNQKPKKGIQFLQEKGLLRDPMDNNQVAQWLRENPRLDKKMIGEYISDRKNMELLDSFVNTFTFQGLRIDEALRLYLEAFRLPGEAPVIQRLLETFTDNWHKVNGSPFMTNDAGFALAYAVIMLNTDQHNHNVRKQNIPMTVEDGRAHSSSSSSWRTTESWPPPMALPQLCPVLLEPHRPGSCVQFCWYHTDQGQTIRHSLNGGYRNHDKKKSHKYDSSKSRLRKKAGGREKEAGGGARRGGGRASGQRPSRSHSDDEEDEGIPASYHTVSLQVSQDLLDLMHTLHTRAASIYSSWAEEQRHLEAAGRKIEADSQTLWTSCWCPLLQGIAWLCCDARRQVRMQALTYLQRALLVHDLQTLDAAEWESCFNKVLFPLLTKLLDNISPADVGGMEETRMRACTLLSKVFLQHLSPLLSLPTFAALWLTILDFMDKYMHAGSSDLLLEAIPESLKNMLLVMDTAGIFHSADSRTGYSDLWEITWERIVCFLPHLREELFKQTVIPDAVPGAPAESVQPSAPAARPPSPQAAPPPAQPPSPVPFPVSPTEPQPPSRPASPQDPQPSSANGNYTPHPPNPTYQPVVPAPPSMSPIPVPLAAPPPQTAQPPLILQPLASPLQVGVPPMSLPIILNPALIEATSPVPLLPGPRPTSPSDEVK
ncbi:Golgi-specific brefeldin A-resistance guanine nucleotide exchange factor 1 [Sphaeramia orbicularis]|uniref:Golgi-specific brefeldin A-resistance guanine nucleotide exchange factor 1 n=1 Tax=Sphaeramia orbicularis TaxID=375764 RepID=UPI0011808C6B|nr:Golgi-specific brefeldin A-resistance guanine nucleotide exchange factor 1 [Sphaeramia orbicularis]